MNEMPDPAEIISRMRRHLTVVFVSLYVISVAVLIAVNQAGERLVRWSVDRGLNASDILWFIRLVPGIFGCIGATAFFMSRWYAIDARRKFNGLSESGARLRAYLSAAVAGVLFIFVVHLLLGGPP